MAADDRIQSLIYLPCNTPKGGRVSVEAFDGVPGYCITSTLV